MSSRLWTDALSWHGFPSRARSSGDCAQLSFMNTRAIDPQRTQHGRDARVTGLVSRRQALWRLGGGLGGIALSSMLGRDELLAGSIPGVLAKTGGLHFPAKAKRVVQ